MTPSASLSGNTSASSPSSVPCCWRASAPPSCRARERQRPRRRIPLCPLAAGAGDSDALHVAIHPLALERAGFALPRTEIDYRASCARALVALTAELGAAVLRVIAAMRRAQRPVERPSPDASSSPSTCLPSSGLLGPRAKEGAVSVDELTRAYVTRVHAMTHQNRTEAARRTGLNWRTAGQRIDPARLGRWLHQAVKKTEPK